MTVGHRRASGQMRIAVALRDRLPRVAALALTGAVSARLVSTITWRTQLVDDDRALAMIDTAITERATSWGPLSEQKLDKAIDFWIEQYDPEAVLRTESSARTLDFTVGDTDDPAGVTSVWGRLSATDAEMIKRRIAEMAHGVCADDPRTIGARRAAAAGALGAGNDHIVCECGSPTCPAAGEAPYAHVVIRVVAEQSAVDAATKANAATGPAAEAPPIEIPAAPAEAAATQTNTAAAQAKVPAALIMGGGVLPTRLLAEVIRGGAKVRPITLPGSEPEPGYRPSPELAEFVRFRDLFCRAPGCDIPADKCDIDHTTPYPFGPTHASNLKCLCRTNHLGKTFDGWHDIQLPDGTVIWTSPSGHTYITKPGSRLYFPMWDTTTSDLPPPPVIPTAAARGLAMPTRRRSRAAQRASHIRTERARNNAGVARGNDPPPF